MARMMIDSKANSFHLPGTTWKCGTELEIDVVIEIDDVSFFLHKFPLINTRWLLQKLLTKSHPDHDETICTLTLKDIPGGSKSFGLIAKFCYGKNCEMDRLCRIADKSEKFLINKILTNWGDSVKALNTCESNVSRCIDSLDINVISGKPTYSPSLVDEISSSNGHKFPTNFLYLPQHCTQHNTVFPYVISADNIEDANHNNRKLRFYSIISDKIFETHKSLVVGQRAVIPYSRYIIMENFPSNLSLLNPVSGEDLNLPPLDYNFENVPESFVPENHPPRQVIWSNAIDSQDYIVVSNFETQFKIALWKIGQSKWIYSDQPLGIEEFACCAVQDEKFICIDSSGKTWITNFARGEISENEGVEIVQEVFALPFLNYLIPNCNGIFRIKKYTNGPTKFRVYRLEEEEWIEVYNIVDCSIFLNHRNGFFLYGSVPEYNGNIFYYEYDNVVEGDIIYKYNMVDKTISTMYHPFETILSWCVPF